MEENLDQINILLTKEGYYFWMYPGEFSKILFRIKIMSDEDMWASAHSLVQIYGDKSCDFIRKHIVRYKEAGDQPSLSFWEGINAMVLLLGTGPQAGHYPGRDPV